MEGGSRAGKERETTIEYFYFVFNMIMLFLVVLALPLFDLTLMDRGRLIPFLICPHFFPFAYEKYD